MKYLLLIPLLLLAGCGTANPNLKSECVEWKTVVSQEIEIVQSWGDDDFYYIYKFDDGSVEIENIYFANNPEKKYEIGSKVCLNKIFK